MFTWWILRWKIRSIIIVDFNQYTLFYWSYEKNVNHLGDHLQIPFRMSVVSNTSKDINTEK